jgi:hypothetical protein
LTGYSSPQGILGTVWGSSSSNVTVHNSQVIANFTGNGIVGNISQSPLGGGIYVGTTNFLEVDSCSFQSISLIESGGAFYINRSNTITIKNSFFGNNGVRTSGGILSFILF